MGGQHVIENVQLVTAEANAAKGQMGQEAFISLCQAVAKTHQNGRVLGHGVPG